VTKPVFLPKLPHSCCVKDAPLKRVTVTNQARKTVKTNQWCLGNLTRKSLFLEVSKKHKEAPTEVKINIFGSEIGSKFDQGLIANVIIGVEMRRD